MLNKTFRYFIRPLSFKKAILRGVLLKKLKIYVMPFTLKTRVTTFVLKGGPYHWTFELGEWGGDLK